MRQLKFKYAKASNFLCFGPEGVEVQFDKYGPIVVVQSQNLDVVDENGKAASNGVGKSSLPEIVVYSLFGKTIKKPKKLSHSDIINFQSGKELSVEFQWDEYRVVRTRTRKGKTDSGTLRLWKSAEGDWTKETEITKGGMPATQELIENIIGLSYEAFVNIFIFTDDISSCFLECDGPTKREIVENLLSLDKYRGYVEGAKEALKTFKDDIKLLAKDYDHLLVELASGKQRVTKVETQEMEWLTTKKKEATGLKASLEKKEKELSQSDGDGALKSYREAQAEITELTEKIPEYKEQKAKLVDVMEEVKPKCSKVQDTETIFSRQYREANDVLADCVAIIAKHKKVVESIQKDGLKECPTCEGNVDETKSGKILLKSTEIIVEETVRKKELEANVQHEKKQLDETRVLLKKLTDMSQQVRTRIEALESEITKAQARISQLARVKAPDTTALQMLLENQISECKQQIVAKEAEISNSPFKEIMATIQQELVEKQKECDTKKIELDTSEAEIPYYDFWVKAFGDNGIRKYVIDGIIPALNSRVAYWLQYLIDSRIRLEFDNKLDEKIDRYPFKGRPYVYHGMSGGQRRRLNLTISQSFAYIRELNSGASPSVVWLDEVTMNMDEVGVEGIYRMICELAKDKQVFVIDHNPVLLQMLDGCDTIQLEMKDEVTKMMQ